MICCAYYCIYPDYMNYQNGILKTSSGDTLVQLIVSVFMEIGMFAVLIFYTYGAIASIKAHISFNNLAKVTGINDRKVLMKIITLHQTTGVDIHSLVEKYKNEQI